MSHSCGCGAFAAMVFSPLVENVGLLQSLMLIDCGSTPGILAIWSKLAVTRLIGSGEYPSDADCCCA